jgi:hypothetical protein
MPEMTATELRRRERDFYSFYMDTFRRYQSGEISLRIKNEDQTSKSIEQIEKESKLFSALNKHLLNQNQRNYDDIVGHIVLFGIHEGYANSAHHDGEIYCWFPGLKKRMHVRWQNLVPIRKASKEEVDNAFQQSRD